MPSLLQKQSPAIILTGLMAGLLDGLAAITSYVIKTGKDPAMVFKFIASGIFGRKAFAGGTTMVAWGVLFHFIIAFIFTILFFWIYPKIKWIGNNKIIAGLLYGIIVWVIMNRLVVPLSNTPQQPFHLKNAIIGMLILMCFIGLPISLMANKHYLYKK